MIEVKNIEKKYGKKKVLSGISFSAQSGEMIAIIGKNGCGKSTLLQIMAGCLKADAGKITYYNQDAKDKVVYRKFTGYVPQDNPFMEQLTVKDNLKLWKKGTNEQLSRAMQEFALTDILSMPVASLSGGMKRRLAIACALMNCPPIVLLDEPTTALDFAHKDKIGEMLKKHRDNGGIVILATHDEEEIQYADRVLLMKKGVLSELEKDSISKEMLIDIYNEGEGEEI